MSVSFFFFFKQKTAYEMRISDWSSDVCSSDLDYQHVEQQVTEVAGVQGLQPRLIEGVEMLALAVGISFPVGGVEVGRGQAAVLPFVDQPRELARRPTLQIGRASCRVSVGQSVSISVVAVS